MEFIKKYTPNHYEHYKNDANGLILKYQDINSWIRSLDDKNILIWLNVLKRVNDKKNKNDAYFQEIAIFFTLLIRLFILELDVEDNLILKDAEIEKLVLRFDYIIKNEYAIRKELFSTKKENEKYTLLHDVKKE